MGIIGNLVDKALDKAMKTETINLPFEQLAQIVKDEFMPGADDEFLKKLEKTAKGSLFRAKCLDTASGRYQLYVGVLRGGFNLSGRRNVWIMDREVKKFYQLDKPSKWKKFYKLVRTDVRMERVNRNR